MSEESKDSAVVVINRGGNFKVPARTYLKYESSEGDEVIVPKAIVRKFKVLDD